MALITEVPTAELRRALRATEPISGADSIVVRRIRLELEQRKKQRHRKAKQSARTAEQCPTAWFAEMESAFRKGDLQRAAKAAKRLRELGVSVTFDGLAPVPKQDVTE